MKETYRVSGIVPDDEMDQDSIYGAIEFLRDSIFENIRADGNEPANYLPTISVNENEIIITAELLPWFNEAKKNAN